MPRKSCSPTTTELVSRGVPGDGWLRGPTAATLATVCSGSRPEPLHQQLPQQTKQRVSADVVDSAAAALFQPTGRHIHTTKQTSLVQLGWRGKIGVLIEEKRQTVPLDEDR